jgi:modulator of FtsH protease HflK
MLFGNDNNRKKSPWEDDDSKSNKIPQANLDEFLKKGQNSFNDAYKKLKDADNNLGGGFKIFYLIGLVLLFVWLSTGFYVVDEGEQALVIRFGKYQRTANTGLNYHLPNPIEEIIIEKVETLRKEEVGFRSNISQRDFSSDSSTNSKNVAQESLMLTGDENIVDINFIVQWKIANLKDYVFNIYNTRETVRSVAESAMREVVGNTALDNAIAEGRSNIEHEAKDLLQKILDSYNSGVQITTLKLLRADPPIEVIDAFRDVQTARTDKEREINRALAFHNEIIPKARGEAAQIISESEAYKKEVVEIAKGNAARFSLVLDQYKIAKDITKKRIYLETMETVLKGMDKMIIDNKNAGIVPYLPLNKLEKVQ